MQKLLGPTFRGYLIDHHSPAPPDVTLDKLDPEEYRRFFRTARLNCVMMYTKDHWGYNYYPSNYGQMHPGLKTDWVAEIARILKEESIEFNAYYCLEYDTLNSRLHPEWAVKDSQGNPVTLKGRMAKWGMPCYETGYREVVLGQISEILSWYKPDSLFLDIFGKSLCYCPICRKRFRDTYGYDLPESPDNLENEKMGLDFGSAGQDVNEFLDDCAERMLIDIKEAASVAHPGVPITINFAALYPRQIRDKLDYEFTEPWAGNYLSAAYSRDTARGHYPQLGPGDVSEVYNYRHQNIYNLAAAQIAAGGCRVFFYSGSQHVDGTLEHEESRRIGEAFKPIQKIEHVLVDREVVADVAILQSDLSARARSGNIVIANAIGRCKQSSPHRDAVLGAMTVLDSANITWAVVPEDKATYENLCKYKLVMAPGLFHVSSELKEAISRYVQSGGKLVVDGLCGLYSQKGREEQQFQISDVLGIEFLEHIADYESAKWGGYVELIDNSFSQDIPETFLPTSPRQVKVRQTTAAVCAKLRHPTVALSEERWVNWWCPPPASESSPFPAITRNSFGEGVAYYFAYDVFSSVIDGNNMSRHMLVSTVNQCIPEPGIKLDTSMPDSISIMVYRQANRLIVHNLSHIAERTGGDAPIVPGGTLCLHNSIYSVSSANLIYPDAAELSLEKNGDYTRVELPELTIHQVAVIQLRDR